jgi:hypothetical protein
MNQKQFDLQRVYVFQQKIEFFNFVIVISRFDIIFATAKLVQFLKNSNLDHMNAVDRINFYLNEIKNLVIKYLNEIANILLYVNDATFADNKLTRKSSNDYLFKLNKAFID